MRFNFFQSSHYCTLQIRTVLQTKTTKNAMKNDHLFQIIRTEFGGSGSGKTNALLNLIKEQDDTDKIYFYLKDLSESKH